MLGRSRVEVLQEVLEGFNEHDLDKIMFHFSEDCVFGAPRGPDRCGRRFVGKEEVRQGLGVRFEGIPDVQYLDDNHLPVVLGVFPSGRSRARRSMASRSTCAAVTSGCSMKTD